MTSASYSSALHSIDTRFFGFLELVGWRLVIGLLASAAILTITCQVLSITHRFPLDYGEAPLVDQAVRLIGGENIYRSDLSQPPYTISNYPPGFILFLSPWVALFGPNFWAGRVISSMCAWLCAFLCGMIVQRLTGDRLAGWLSGGLFIGIPYVTQWSSFSRIDLLALAFSLAGISIFIRQPHRSQDFILGGGLLVMSIFTRQSFVLAAPLAVMVWLLFDDWRAALRLAIWMGITILGIGVLLQILSSGGFFFNIVTANVNEFALFRLEMAAKRVWHDLPVMILFSALSLLAGFWKMKSWKLLVPYLLGGAASAITIGKIGSNVNYLLELSAAVSMACGAVIFWARSKQSTKVFRVAVAGLVVFQLILMIQTTSQGYLSEITYRRSQAADLRQLEKIIAGSVGDIPADEYMGIGVLQRRRVYLQPFEMTQLVKAGQWDERKFIEQIRAKVFPFILVHYFPGYAVYKERWTPQMLAAIDNAYETREILADTHVYFPKTGLSP